MKVLIVDDNFNDREGIKDLVKWKSFGFDEIYLAQNGKDGYEQARRICPTLVLADVSMPVMDGLEMAEEILKELPDTKFIFMSCFDDVKYITTAIDRNAFGYLLKPIDVPVLTQTIEKVLKIDGIEKERASAMEKLKKQVDEYAPFVKEQLLRDFMFGAQLSTDKLKLFGINISGSFGVAVIDLCETENNDILIFQIKEILDGCNRKNNTVYSFVDSRNRLAALINFGERFIKEQAVNEMIEFMMYFRDSVLEEHGTDVNICIGGTSDRSDEAYELLRQAETVANEHDTYNGIILADEFKSDDALLNYNILELKTEVVEILRSSDLKQLTKLVHQYYNKEKVYSAHALHGFSFIIISILQMVLLEENESFENIFGNEYSIWNKLVNYADILDIQQWIYNIFKSVVDYLDAKKSEDARYIKLVKEIKQIIKEDYAVIDNIGQITNRLYISSSYANHLFKLREGITIFDYLIQTRMERAKIMLKDRTNRIYEISELIGYKSTAYFGTLFKEYTGVTPKMYRETYSANK